jgi:hypothetical protein
MIIGGYKNIITFKKQLKRLTWTSLSRVQIGFNKVSDIYTKDIQI